MWRNRYELSVDGRPLTVWDGRVWRSGGEFDLEGHHYDVTSNMLGTRWELTDENRIVHAVADRVGRKRWTVTAHGMEYRFQRSSWWRPEETLLAGDQPVGYVKRESMWRTETVADLPGLPVQVQVFVVVVVLTMWDAQASSGG